MGKLVGAIEVFYEQQFPKADEGPFLKEERRLLDTIAERLGQYLARAAAARHAAQLARRHRAGARPTTAATGASSSSSSAAPIRTC